MRKGCFSRQGRGPLQQQQTLDNPSWFLVFLGCWRESEPEYSKSLLPTLWYNGCSHLFKDSLNCLFRDIYSSCPVLNTFFFHYKHKNHGWQIVFHFKNENPRHKNSLARSNSSQPIHEKVCVNYGQWLWYNVSCWDDHNRV